MNQFWLIIGNDIHLMTISQEIPLASITKIILKITSINFILTSQGFWGYLGCVCCLSSTIRCYDIYRHSDEKFWSCIYRAPSLGWLSARLQKLHCLRPGPTFIKPDQRNPWIKDQIKITLLPTISHLLLPNFVSCGRDKPSHMTQNLVTVGAKLWTAERFLVDPWSMDYADPVW